MSFLLHRDTCVGWVRGQRTLVQHTRQHLGNLHVSALTIFEVEMWVTRWSTPARWLTPYGNLLQDATVLSVDDAIAHQAARLGGRLRSQGHRVDTVTLMVAATALVRGFTLVTHAPHALAHVPGLTFADWFLP